MTLDSVDALAQQFNSLRQQARKPSAASCAIILKMSLVVETARRVLSVEDRRTFRQRVNLEQNDRWMTYTAIGKSYDWLKPHVDSLPAAPSVLVRVAQRMSPDTIDKFIKDGSIHPLMGQIDARKLPPKYVKKSTASRERAAARKKAKANALPMQDFSVRIELAPDGFAVPAAQRFLMRLMSFLKTEADVWDSIDPTFELSPDLKVALTTPAAEAA